MPIERIIEHDNHNKVAVWRISETVEELMQRIRLSEKDLEKVNSFRLEKRKKEWLACRILLQHLIDAYPAVAYTPSGKPYMADESCHISFSHADGYAAVAVSDQNTALDIEICSPRVEKVAQRFMHNAEWAFVNADDRLSYLTLIWSAKEALFKYFDQSMVVFKEHFRIAPFSIKEEGQTMATCFFYDEPVLLPLNFIHLPEFVLVYHLAASRNG